MLEDPELRALYRPFHRPDDTYPLDKRGSDADRVPDHEKDLSELDALAWLSRRTINVDDVPGLNPELPSARTNHRVHEVRECTAIAP